MKEEDKTKLSFKLIWSILMFVIYMALAYFVLFTPVLLPYNYEDNTSDKDSFAIVRVVFGGAVLMYGLFRGYRIIKYKK